MKHFIKYFINMNMISLHEIFVNEYYFINMIMITIMIIITITIIITIILHEIFYKHVHDFNS